MSGSCSESSFGVTSPCLWTRKEKLAGEVERLSSITIPIFFFKGGASGKGTFQTKPAAAFGFLSFPKGNPNGLSHSWRKRSGLFSFLTRRMQSQQHQRGRARLRAWGWGWSRHWGAGSRVSAPSVAAGAPYAWRFPRARSQQLPGAAAPRGAEPPARPGGSGSRKGGGAPERLQGRCRGNRLPPPSPCRGAAQPGGSWAEPKEEPAFPSALLPGVSASVCRSPSAALGPGTAGAASGEDWFRRANSWSLLHAYSEATGVSFALDPGGGRKCECQRNRCGFPHSARSPFENLNKEANKQTNKY